MLGGDFAQQTVVQNYRRAESENGDDEQQSTQQIAISSHKKQQAVCRHRDIAEERHHSLFQVGVVGDAAEKGQEKDLQKYSH